MEHKLGIDEINRIMWLDDEGFEKSVKSLDLRDVLSLMESLQSAMKEEQQRFEELSLQLQKCPDRNSYNHRKISASLCTSQRLLTNLCTKHMMCLGQQSLRSSFTCESSGDKIEVIKFNKMASGAVENDNDRTSGFKESLRFFQNQVEKDIVPRASGSASGTRNTQINGCNINTESDLCAQSKSNMRTTISAPSVDNILSNVKTLCANRDGKTLSDSTSKYPSVHRNFNKDNKTQHKITPIISKTYDNQLSRMKEGVTRTEQVSVAEKVTVSDHSKKPTLLSNFNPTFGLEEDEQDAQKDKRFGALSFGTVILKTNYQIPAANDGKKTILSKSESEVVSNSFPKIISLDKSSSSLKTNSYGSDEQISLPRKSNVVLAENPKVENLSESMNSHQNRTFGHCKDQLLQMEHKTPKLEQSARNASNSCEQTITDLDEEQSNEEDVFEKQSDFFESDYDSQDFVVHKTNFPEDYLEAMSEDNYSSINEDYEVEQLEEQPHGPRIPSPDYASEEDEEIHVRHDEDAEYEDVEFIDNSAQYVNDPRRYIYYPDDKELEVIPEEDEDDIEDDDELYSHEEAYKAGGYHVSNQSSDDSRYNNHGECDSGLTDDQRSSSSTAEECDLEDDTDSAKGSLPLQDSSSESPTYNERANMFQNVEYHKFNNKSFPHKRIIEDYEKPKVNGKDVETVPNINHEFEDSEAVRQVRNITSNWDPQELIRSLYRLDFQSEPLKKQIRYINKEGYMEKLPSGRKKATYWNPWKTKYIKLKDGFLYCFDNNRTEKPSMTLQLMGGHVDSLEKKMIGVDDQKGHYVVLKCSDEDETESWENALRSHCAEDFINAYTSPCLHPLAISKNVIVIDLGSCSVRAGILMSSPTLPQLFFPTVCATNKMSKKRVFGSAALKPNMRKDAQLSFPLHPSAKVTKYSIDVSVLPDLLKHIFCELNVHPENYKIQLSMPRNLSLQTKLKIACILLDDFKVKGINLTHQAILALHAYNSKSGIIVDIGDRLDVIPIIEGYIVESGVTRLPYGGQRMIHHLKQVLAEKNISVVSDVQTYLARYILEQLCYVAEDYNEELQRYHTSPDDFEMSLSTSHFFSEDCLWDEIILDMGRFHVPEGLFTPEKWGIDNPGLHKLVHHAIQECGVDLRREMSRSIYVSGGLTLLPGFAERLETEVDKLTPDTIIPKVHASPYRYHMSYIGACQIALGDKFDDICITKQIWKKEGNTCVKKWHI